MTAANEFDAIALQIEPLLDRDESIVASLPGDGAVIVATSRRVVIVRDGAAHRPRSGVRSMDYWSIRAVAIQQPRNGQGRVAFRTGPYPWQAVSVFFGIRHGAAAATLVEQIRVRIAQARRGT
jgi:hypothetical protein